MFQEDSDSVRIEHEVVKLDDGDSEVWRGEIEVIIDVLTEFGVLDTEARARVTTIIKTTDAIARVAVILVNSDEFRVLHLRINKSRLQNRFSFCWLISNFLYIEAMH